MNYLFGWESAETVDSTQTEKRSNIEEANNAIGEFLYELIRMRMRARTKVRLDQALSICLRNESSVVKNTNQ